MANHSDMPNSQFRVYRDETEAIKIDDRLEGETAWLTQQGLTNL